MRAFKIVNFAVFFCLLSPTISQILQSLSNDFGAIVDSEVAQQKWALMESKVKDFIQEGVKMLLPRAIETTASLNISSSCSRDVIKVLSGLKRMKIWAFKFVDASSMSIGGVLDLTASDLGNYDECVNNEVFDERSSKYKGEVLFRGKYCRVHIRPYLPPRPKKIHILKPLAALRNFTEKDTITGLAARMAHFSYYRGLTTALCVPSGCVEDDINQVLQKAGDYLGIVIHTPRCEVKEETKFTPLMIAVITLYSFTGFLVLTGSAVDVYSSYKKMQFKSTGIRILTSFSFVSNFRKFIDTSSSSETFSCVNCMRTLTITWIIYGHSQMSFAFTLHKAGKLLDMVQEFAYQGIMNSSVDVNTFFFISGTVVCYSLTKHVKIHKKPFNILMYIVHRYWRILPSYFFTTVFVFLIPILASGPDFQDVVDLAVKPCKSNWWATLLFIHNFYEVENMCNPVSWYLAVDMQLHILALFILLPLMKYPKLGITIAVSTIIASMIGSWVTIYVNELMPLMNFSPDIKLLNDMFCYYYVKPHVHIGSYLVGTLCGYFLALYPKFKIPKVIQILGWSASAVSCVSVLYLVQKWNSDVEPTFWEAFFFASCYRVAWSLFVAWVLLCCSTGHGGFVNYIMSLKMWIPLGRLTFLAYLVHPHVMTLYVASVRSEVVIDHRTGVYQYFGHLVLSYLFAFAGSMLIELPFLSLEKVIFPSGNKQESSNHVKQNANGVQNIASLEKHALSLVVSKNEHDLEKHTTQSS